MMTALFPIWWPDLVSVAYKKSLLSLWMSWEQRRPLPTLKTNDKGRTEKCAPHYGYRFIIRTSKVRNKIGVSFFFLYYERNMETNRYKLYIFHYLKMFHFFFFFQYLTELWLVYIYLMDLLWILTISENSIRYHKKCR